MTIKTLIDDVQVEGEIVVKQWDDENETYTTLAEVENPVFSDDVLDKEIKYIYAIDGTLTIEV